MRLTYMMAAILVGTNLCLYSPSSASTKNAKIIKKETNKSTGAGENNRVKALAKSLKEECARDLPGCHFETLHSLGKMGPKAKSAIPELRGVLYDYVHGMYAAAAISRIAPELKDEYFEILIRALDNDVYIEEEYDGKKIKKWMNTGNSIQYSEILDALGDLGPSAKQAVPNIKKFLRERAFEEWDKASGEKALKKIAGEGKGEYK